MVFQLYLKATFINWLTGQNDIILRTDLQTLLNFGYLVIFQLQKEL